MSPESSSSTNGQLLFVLVLYILLKILERETPPETVGISHLHSLAQKCLSLLCSPGWPVELFTQGSISISWLISYMFQKMHFKGSVEFMEGEWGGGGV